MDRRLLLEFLPGIVLLLTNVFFDLFVATGAAILAAVIATTLRYRMDRQLPFIAIATVVLFVVLLAILNEVVWRSTSTETWVVFHAASDPVMFLLYWLVTWRVANRYWHGAG